MRFKTFAIATFALASALCLTGCTKKVDATQANIDKLPSGTRVELGSYEELQKYLEIKLVSKPTLNDENCVVRISNTLTTRGYQNLSYFIDSITFSVGYEYLTDAGDYVSAKLTISTNPDKTGSSAATQDYNCNYRAIRDVKITKSSCDGFAVRK